MKKLIIPILIGVFPLLFSGKPVSKNNCGPTIIIDAPPPPDFGITRVDVRNNTTGITTTYNNPTFPITHTAGQGYQMNVIFYFDDVYHGGIYVSDPCGVVNFHNEGYGAIWFNAYCNTYYVDLLPSSADVTWYCP